MYDNTDIVLRSDKAPETDFMRLTPRYFEVTGEHRFENGGVSLSGCLGGLRISVTKNNVKIANGSLCKWYLGDNFQTLTRSDAKRAFEKLSDILHLPLSDADVTRIDIAQNLIMKYNPEAYFNHLGELSRHKRLPQPSGLYYQNGIRQILYYNKVKEQKYKGQPIPEIYLDRNVLRYELRYKSRLPEIFKTDRITGADLYSEPFYIKIINQWHSLYNGIQKINLLQIDYGKMTTVKDLQLLGVAEIIFKQGGIIAFYEQLDQAQKRGELTSKQKYDIKRLANEACEQSSNMKKSELITELDKKIGEAIKFYR